MDLVLFTLLLELLDLNLNVKKGNTEFWGTIRDLLRRIYNTNISTILFNILILLRYVDVCVHACVCV